MKAISEELDFSEITVGSRVTVTMVREEVVSLGVLPLDAMDEMEDVVEDVIEGDDDDDVVNAVSESVNMVATVISIDSEAYTATLKLADGTFETLPVRRDVRLADDMVGKKLKIHVVETILIQVEEEDD